MIDFDKLAEYEVPKSRKDGFIYFLFYKEKLIYIGQTTAIMSRIVTHKVSLTK